MKKQIITKQDIQRDLLALLNKRKTVTVWLTAIVSISAFLYVIYVSLYASGIYLPTHSLIFSPTEVMVIVPIVILLMVGFLVHYYYLKFFEIKNGKFSIIQDKLSHKKRELKKYYRRFEKENTLYFPSGKIAVDDTVYSASKAGDCFYLIKLKSSKAPFFAYHTKNYEINDRL